MSNNFSRRRRGMRFRPKGGLGPNPQKPDRDATQARAEVVSEQGGADRLFEKRHTQEIERAENIAAGLPPEGAQKPETPATIPDKKDFREPHSEIPAQVQEEKEFQPVEIQQPSKGILDSIKNVATILVKKVQKMIRPEKKTHKEVVINAETLETRVAVLEDGKLEEF
ncbi:MAG TPA: ribonuclease E/G, partial [Candidatus Dormibacteraeota bacterium]|nr:ribonuclease E/G [Candidatus Dormibacteraeota bacterium]